MAKRINISIMDDKAYLLDDFDAKCKDVGLSRSAALLQLIEQFCGTFVTEEHPDVKASPTAQQSAQTMVDEFGTGVVAKPEVKAAQKALNEHSRTTVDMLPEWLR